MVFCSILYVRPYRLQTDNHIEIHIEIDIEQKLEIINIKERREMDKKEAEESWERFESEETGERKEQNQKISSFFERFGDFFENDAKKAIFLEGALAQFLLDIQHKERGRAPFKTHLNGLLLDEKQIKKLLPKIQNRLEEYGKTEYQILQSIIAKYFVLAGSEWQMPKEEISFSFVLGMNLAHFFEEEGFV